MVDSGRRSIADIVEVAFALLFRNPLVFVLAAVPQIVLGLLALPFARHKRIAHGLSNSVQFDSVSPAPADDQPFQHLFASGTALSLLPLFSLVILIFVVIFGGILVVQQAATLKIVTNIVAGRNADVGDAYRNAVGWALRFFLPGVLVTLILAAGSVPTVAFIAVGTMLGAKALVLTIGGITILVWFLFVSIRYAFVLPAVVLEGRRGFDALKRSAALGDGTAWRIFGVVVATAVILMVVHVGSLLVSHLLGFIVGMIGGTHSGGLFLVAALISLFQGWFGQISLIVLTLLYLDLAGADNSPVAGTTLVERV